MPSSSPNSSSVALGRDTANDGATAAAIGVDGRDRGRHRGGNVVTDVSCAKACCAGATPIIATARPTAGTPINRTRRARPINPESSRFFIRCNTLPTTPQATRDYQRRAEPPGLNPDGSASGVPRATLSSDPAGVNRGSARPILLPRYPGQQVTLSVSNARAVPAVSPRNVRSDAVVSLW